jgi:hypothetical protein
LINPTFAHFSFFFER